MGTRKNEVAANHAAARFTLIRLPLQRLREVVVHLHTEPDLCICQSRANEQPRA
jgi:hypothetical protein